MKATVIYFGWVLRCLLVILVPASHASARMTQQTEMPGPEFQVAYSSLVEGHWQIFVATTDGEKVRRLTFDALDKRAPAWTPSGTSIAYVTPRGNAYLLDLKTLNYKPILRFAWPILDLDIHADGRVVFTRIVPNRNEARAAFGLRIWTCADILGESPRLLTVALGSEQQACWILGNDRHQVIASRYLRSEKQSQLVWKDLDNSSDPRVLLTESLPLDRPDSSPNGNRIVYSSSKAGNPDLWLLDLITGASTRLTRHGANDRNAVFSRNGESLVFESNRDGFQTLWRIPLDVGLPERFLKGDAPARDPDWLMQGSGSNEFSVDTLSISSFSDGSGASLSLGAGSNRARLAVFDLNGHEVQSLGELRPGIPTAWKHEVNSGGLAEPGLYVVGPESSAPGTYRASSKWDPQLDVEDFLLDPEKKTVSFTLPKPAWLKVQVGQSRGALFQVPVKWVAVRAGHYKINLDGSLPYPFGNFWNDSRMLVRVRAIALPSNFILVGGPGGSALEQGVPASSVRQGALPIGVQAESPIEVEVTGQQGVSSIDQLPIVGSDAKLRINVPKGRGRDALFAGRYELMVYLDGQFLFEDEDCSLPTTLPLGLENISSGRHCLLVNLVGQQGVTACLYVPFRIGADQ